MENIIKIHTRKEYENYKRNNHKMIINSSLIKDIEKDQNIIGIYLENDGDIADSIAYINYYKIQKVIIGNRKLEEIKKIIELINPNASIEIEINNTMSEEEMNQVYSFLSSSNRNIGVYASMMNRDTKVYKIFKSYITTIDVDNCSEKEQCIEDAKIIHFDGTIIGSSTSNKKGIRKNDMTFYSLIQKNVRTMPNKELFTFLDFDHNSETNYTYEEFNNQVDAAAKGLLKLGVQKGNHIALWMNSIPEWFIYFYAITKIGAIAIPINKDNREYDMDHILKSNDVNILIMSNGHEKNRYMNTMKKLIPGLNNGCIKSERYPHLKNIITIGFDENGCISHEECVKNGEKISEEELNKVAENVYNDDIAIILPTSGTTGRPKGVMLTHESVIHNGSYIGDHLELDQNDIMGIIVTMFHCFGVTLSMTAAMTHNSKMVIPAYYRPYHTVEMIHNYHVSCLNGAPKHFEGLIEAYDQFMEKTKCQIKSLKKGIMAGANCSSKLMKAVDKIFGMRVISVYGQTELAPGDTMSCVSDPEEVRHHTVGKKFDYVDMKVVDDQNHEVPDGKMGEIVVKSPDVMVGYYGDMESTKEMYDEDGYFHSGDLAIKENDYYKIVDRKKNIIIRNGENIQPMEVEEAIRTIRGVTKACVFGVKVDESNNQFVVAAVVREDPSITSEFILQELKKKIAGYKIPSKIYFVRDLEYNANGKIVIKNQETACKKIEAKKLVKTLNTIIGEKKNAHF